MSVADTGIQKVRKTSRVLHQCATWGAGTKYPRNPMAMPAAH
jgi:hypothetical protein